MKITKTFIIICLTAIIIFLAKGNSDINSHNKGDNICIGTKDRISMATNSEHHIQNLRERYTNCTYVEGNLELTWLQGMKDLDFLKNITVVSGYVLISHVNVKKILLPSLQIIKGQTLFKLEKHHNRFSLIVVSSIIENLEMPALYEIMDGSVGIIYNSNFCHIQTIKWEQLMKGSRYKFISILLAYEANRFSGSIAFGVK
jgi:L1 cell adhesion molecule